MRGKRVEIKYAVLGEGEGGQTVTRHGTLKFEKKKRGISGD